MRDEPYLYSACETNLWDDAPNPPGRLALKKRFKLAWLVFIGTYSALSWVGTIDDDPSMYTGHKK